MTCILHGDYSIPNLTLPDADKPSIEYMNAQMRQMQRAMEKPGDSMEIIG